MLDELWEKVAAFVALLASSGLLGWLLGRRREDAEVRQIEITTEDAHDRLLAELRKMDAETNRVSVETLIRVIESARQMAQDYKAWAGALEAELDDERQARAEDRAQWEAEREALREELAGTQRQLGELARQVEAQAAITEAQTAIIGQQQEEIAALKEENTRLRADLSEERERRRELEERIEDRDQK
jgi:hypothetical protein